MATIDPTELGWQLNEPFALMQDAIDYFHENGYVKLRQVLSPEVLDFYGAEITRLVKLLNTQTKPIEQRTTYEKAFLQIMNLWTQSESVKEFAFSKRLARIAAELMGVDGVRMYHDQALYKEPGGGITPWHADQYYWPVSTANTVTVWVPLQETPLDLGPLSFSIGSHRFEKGRELAISDESEAKIKFSLRDQPVDETPYGLGDVSYHSGWTFHRAAPNTSDRPRAVMTMIYIEDGIRLAEPKNKSQQGDWAKWMPGAQIGELVDTPLNPMLYRRV